MGVRVEWVRYGRPAAEALRAELTAAKGGEPLAPVTVVVPSNYVGVATRRLLASGALGPVCGRAAGLAAVNFVTVYRLAELLGARRLAAEGRRPVSTPVIAAALRAALAARPGMFGPVAEHPATETALIAAYRELRDLSAPALDALARTGARAGDVVRLAADARARLAARHYDEEDLLDAAVATLAAGEHSLDDFGAVVVHLPEVLTRHGARLVRAVCGGDGGVVLAGVTGDRHADAEVARSVRRLVASGEGDDPIAAGGVDPAAVDGLDPMAVVDTDRTSVVTMSDGDDEVRHAVRVVLDAVRGGTALDRVAILHASPEPYARLVHEHLDAAGVAHNGDAVVPLTARLAGRTLLQLLELPAAGFRREEVSAWLAGAPLLDGGRPVPLSAWERISRDAGVVAGRGDWDRRLAAYAEERDALAAAEAADPDAPFWRVERRRRQAEHARGLRAYVVGLIDELAAEEASARPWRHRAAWARRRLVELVGGERRRERWPAAERTAAERVERALERLARLDELEPSSSLDVFTRTLRHELESDLGRVGRMGEGVLVGTLAMGVGLDLDLVVVLGLVEGLCPGAPRQDSLLPDTERAVTGGELPLRAERTGRQHRQLLAALAGSGRHVLCVPRGDLRRNVERVPSRWALQIAGALAGARWWSEDLLLGERPWLSHVASFDAGLRTMDTPATAQEHRLRSLMAAAPGRGSPDLEVIGDGVAAAGAAMVAGRRSPSFTRFDGNLAGLAVPSPVDRVTSATRLEGWAGCPFSYLARDVLGVDEVENPEDRLEIAPVERGSLVHEVLERFVGEVLARPAQQRPAPDQPWSADDRARMAALGAEVCDRYEAHGKTGRALFWRRERRIVLAELDRFLAEDDAQRRRLGTRPLAAELAFGMGGAGALDAVALSLPDGRQVRFRGKADRVDLGDDGVLHVVDYKTGRADPYRGLSEDDPDAAGTCLQLPVYGQAARLAHGDPDAAVEADYWFVSTRGDFRRIGYRVTPGVLGHVGGTLGTIVAGIEHGVFPAFPTASSTTPFVVCPYCDPDGLGVTELRRQLERKLGDPALAGFGSLVAGDELTLDLVAAPAAPDGAGAAP